MLAHSLENSIFEKDFNPKICRTEYVDPVRKEAEIGEKEGSTQSLASILSPYFAMSTNCYFI
jgi:hypothetical protein